MTRYALQNLTWGALRQRFIYKKYTYYIRKGPGWDNTVIAALLLLLLLGMLLLAVLVHWMLTDSSNSACRQLSTAPFPQYARDSCSTEYYRPDDKSTSSVNACEKPVSTNPRAAPLPRCPRCEAAIGYNDPRCCKCGYETHEHRG